VARGERIGARTGRGRPTVLRLSAYALIVCFCVLAAALFLARSPERETRALRHFSAEDLARGRQFGLERRLLFWTGTVVELGLLLWLALSGVAPRLAEAARRLSGDRWPVTLLLVGAACFLLHALVTLPFRLYGGLYHLRAWGLTDRSFVSWLGDTLKGMAVSAGLGGLLVLLLYAAIRLLPRTWWLAAGLGSGMVGMALAFLLPLLVAPLFNRFVPLAETPHAPLLPRVRALAARGGLPVRDVLVMDASRQGHLTNAYFAGFGSTRRIVLFDTLLASHTEDETLSILAHEMGHWRHQHIAKGLALATLGSLVGFFLLSRLLDAAAASRVFGFEAPRDPGSLPLILLLAFVGSFLVAPIENAISRHFERQADRAALEMGGAPQVFIAAQQRLVRDNIGNPAPSTLSIVLFGTHPPAIERIEMAEAWAGKPGVR
jgi:STE24 endopeptidase